MLFTKYLLTLDLKIIKKIKYIVVNYIPFLKYCNLATLNLYLFKCLQQKDHSLPKFQEVQEERFLNFQHIMNFFI